MSENKKIASKVTVNFGGKERFDNKKKSTNKGKEEAKKLVFLLFLSENEDTAKSNKERPGDGYETGLDGCGTTDTLIEKEKGNKSTEKFQRNDFKKIFKIELLPYFWLAKEEGNDDG